MKGGLSVLGLAAFTAALGAAVVPAPSVAQQVTGTLGSPGATTTIPNTQLPPPDPKFGGVIKDGALQSKPWWAPRVVPPKGAPNVLLIITDDAGFGAFAQQLEYKCDWYGKTLVRVDRWFPSSKVCSACGHICESMLLEVRDWMCPECGTHHDRDENAAKNILAVGQTESRKRARRAA